MSGCGENTRKFHLYLDSELPAAEALEFERHLMDCRDCQGRYQNLRSVADMVRGAKPLYDVPDSSLAGARALVANHERSRRWHWQLSAAAAVLIVAGAGVLGTVLAHHGASSGFPDFAVQAHDRYASSGMPLAVVSSRPEVVSGWLRQRLAFPLELPQYPAIPGQTKPYRLVGAGVLPF